MSITTTRAQRRQLRKENSKQSMELQLIPRLLWPEIGKNNESLLRVWRSREFLVQEYYEPSPALVRLSVLRADIDPASGRWVDGITWDDLQRIKNECGYSDHDALEAYPAAKDVVNVANLRHIWVMQSKVEFVWRGVTP